MNIKNLKKYIIIIGILLVCFGIEQFVFHNFYSNKENKYSEYHVEGIKKYASIDTLRVKNEEEPVILFASDYQGDYRYDAINYLFTFAKKHVKPNLFVVCGDYRVSSNENYTESEYGILELGNTINAYFKNVPMIFIQGNHDLANTYGLVKKQYFSTNKYIIYNINEDEFPSNQDVEKNSEKKVKGTSEKLEQFLEKQVKLNNKKPIFIATHVPLHYSNRNDGQDNKYAQYLFDVINKYSKDLDIVYLFGHQHSGTYDDYLGGSINFVSKGNTIKVGGSNIEETINFTYMNAGYIGYSNNTKDKNSTNELTISSIKVKNDTLEIQRYTVDKIYYDESIVIERINKAS